MPADQILVPGEILHPAFVGGRFQVLVNSLFEELTAFRAAVARDELFQPVLPDELVSLPTEQTQ